MPPSSDEEEPTTAPKFVKGPPVPTDSAPSSISGWSVAASAAPSAKEMWKHELLQNKLEKVRLEEREKTEKERMKSKALLAQCTALRAQLTAAKKRSRPAATAAPSTEVTLEDEAPKKKPSPEPKPPVKPVGHLVDIMAAARGKGNGQSDDEVEDPKPRAAHAELGPERTTVCQKFQQLNSVLCAYKQGLIDPKNPKEVNFTYGVCAQMCEQEVKELANWTDEDKVRLFPAIQSAFHIVYPDKVEEWHLKPCRQSPEPAAEYWGKVLERRAELWRAAEAKQKRTKLATPELRSVRQMARDKLMMRLKSKIVSLTPALAGSTHKPIPISSGSDTDDLDASHVAAGAAAESLTPKQDKKMAPGPSSYTHAEMKTFARMARTIRNFDEEVGHSQATAHFIDTEFSNNTGRASRCHSSSSAWKKTRFNAAAQKSAKILEDRYMRMYPMQ